MARASIIQRIALEGADEIKRALAEIGKAGEQALRQIQDAGKGADFAKEFTGEFAKVEEAAAQVRQRDQRGYRQRCRQHQQPGDRGRQDHQRRYRGRHRDLHALQVCRQRGR